MRSKIKYVDQPASLNSDPFLSLSTVLVSRIDEFCRIRLELSSIERLAECGTFVGIADSLTT
jgi:hypothetical protein